MYWQALVLVGDFNHHTQPPDSAGQKTQKDISNPGGSWNTLMINFYPRDRKVNEERYSAGPHTNKGFLGKAALAAVTLVELRDLKGWMRVKNESSSPGLHQSRLWPFLDSAWKNPMK